MILFILTIFLSAVSFGQDKVGHGSDSEGCDSSGIGLVTTWVKPITSECGETVTIFGEEYPVVQIGDQCWLGKNLHYNDSEGGVSSYGNNSTISSVYGYLYSWDAASRIDGLISGWHLPSIEEIKTLLNNIDPDHYTSEEGSEMYPNATEYLKESGINHWNTANGSNQSGLTLLGAGQIYKGESLDLKNFIVIWSNENNYGLAVFDTNDAISDNAFDIIDEYVLLSVRLIKD